MKIGIIGSGTSEQDPGRDELADAFIEQGCSVYFFKALGRSINSYYFKSDKTHFIPIKTFRNNMNPFKEIESIFSVRKKVKEEGIDAVIIYCVKNHAAMAIGARLGNCKKIICVVNGSGNLFKIKGIKGNLIRFMAFPMLRIAYAISSYVCFQNPDDKQLFFRRHLIRNKKKIFITSGSGVNLNKYTYSPLSDKGKFLFLARITPSKGICEYIKAAETVKQLHPEVEFDIVGPLDTSVECDIQSVLNTAIERGIVVYHGETQDVFSWIKECRYFVYPSYYPEGVPRCVLQALAVGRPIITCNTPGCKETVIEGVNGFLVPPHNFEALARKMVWMIEHPQEVSKMAKESREYAEKKFDINKVNDVLVGKLIK